KLEDCKIADCVREKGIDNCFYCEEFPCELHKKGFDWSAYHLEGFRPYSNEFLKMFEIFRERMRKREEEAGGR
ncbi:MAG: DUF3795 domain-containing protein, partial [Candidatus Korarchaeota archaeon]|nr:DUF3795 domain-containing protein [Candidatus Korarchaeota archaeon]NIU85710.1 DUF3795 domain-containing protein [Candidatus Thorarchaeota archaeon]NIW14936.1 DUF3795 domain-containing protein [Candidatus Thorarchaeota archaeon]NIW52976.1 DUF3795 domain-containing protein [Candidatus Korarchaeota archaeon]